MGVLNVSLHISGEKRRNCGGKRRKLRLLSSVPAARELYSLY